MQKILTVLLAVCFFTGRAEARSTKQPIILKTATGNIFGVLTTPAKPSGALPVVLIIAGSGPTDRDGNSGQMKGNSLLMLSDSLAKYGIASVRYDKRGIGESHPAQPDERLIRFGNYIDDAASWIALLRRDRHFSRVYVLGHSEGSLIGMVAARQTPVDGYISVAGVAVPGDQILLKQLSSSPEITPGAQDTSAMLLARLKAEGKADDVPKGTFYQALFRPTVQAYLVSWMRYNPGVEIAGLNARTLIIQGTTDIQVDTDQAYQLKAAKPDASLVIIPGMNHMLKAADADDLGGNMASYYEPGTPIVRPLVQTIVAFVKTPAGRKK